MLSWIVLIMLMGLFGVVFFAIFASVFGRGEQVPPMDNTVNVNAANLAAIKDNNLDEIKFATVLRGYRQDQVDVVISTVRTVPGFITQPVIIISPVLIEKDIQLIRSILEGGI